MTSIGIISDIHLRKAHHDKILDALFKIEELLDAQYDIAHTFVLGDLIQDSTTQEDRHHLQKLCSIFDDWISPVTYLLGNHDIKTLTRAEVASTLDQSDFFGKLRVAGQPFVYLDTTQRGISDRGIVGTEQQTWLERSIPTDAVVLSHHPLGPFCISNNVWFQNYPERAHPWDRKEVLNLIKQNTLATIGGHIHQTGRTEFKNIDHIAINAVSKETPTDPVSGHYAVLTIDDSIEIQWDCVLNP